MICVLKIVTIKAVVLALLADGRVIASKLR